MNERGSDVPSLGARARVCVSVYIVDCVFVSTCHYRALNRWMACVMCVHEPFYYHYFINYSSTRLSTFLRSATALSARMLCVRFIAFTCVLLLLLGIVVIIFICAFKCMHTASVVVLLRRPPFDAQYGYGIGVHSERIAPYPNSTFSGRYGEHLAIRKYKSPAATLHGSDCRHICVDAVSMCVFKPERRPTDMINTRKKDSARAREKERASERRREFIYVHVVDRLYFGL